MTTPLSVKGRQGTIGFDGAFVTLTRAGFVARNQFGKGEKRIPLSNVQAVQWKPASILGYGFIQLTIAGGVEKRSKLGKASKDAHQDENSVTFNKGQQDDMRAIYDAIMSGLARIGNGHGGPAAPGGAEEVGRLAGLFQQGLLSQEEFTAAKARALGI